MTVFESKRDAALVGLLYLAAIAALVGGVVILRGSAPQVVKLPAGSLLIGGMLAILWVLNGTQYLIHRGMLTIHCGPFRYEVPLEEIESVVPARDSLYAPALSRDRLAVHTPGREIQISPTDRHGFLEQLA
ncbi:MAG TPA: PH domain-containing protein, partial [Polyangiaceae bacterium]|nr:PH domain-containing protein [Polyangiaceae bacterium]